MAITKDKRASKRKWNIPINVSTSGDNTVLAAGALGPITVHGYDFVAAGTVSVKIMSGATDLTKAQPMVANQQIEKSYNEEGWFQTDGSGALIINLSAAVAVTGSMLVSLTGNVEQVS